MEYTTGARSRGLVWRRTKAINKQIADDRAVTFHTGPFNEPAFTFGPRVVSLASISSSLVLDSFEPTSNTHRQRTSWKYGWMKGLKRAPAPRLHEEFGLWEHLGVGFLVQASVYAKRKDFPIQSKIAISGKSLANRYCGPCTYATPGDVAQGSPSQSSVSCESVDDQ